VNSAFLRFIAFRLPDRPAREGERGRCSDDSIDNIPGDGYGVPMPRGARLDAPGGPHHVMGRGIERRAIFRQGADRADFLSRLAVLGDVAKYGKLLPQGTIRPRGRMCPSPRGPRGRRTELVVAGREPTAPSRQPRERVAHAPPAPVWRSQPFRDVVQPLLWEVLLGPSLGPQRSLTGTGTSHRIPSCDGRFAAGAPLGPSRPRIGAAARASRRPVSRLQTDEWPN